MKYLSFFFKVLLSLLLILGLAFTGKYCLQYYNDMRLKSLKVKMAKIPLQNWDNRYKEATIKNHYKVVYLASTGGEYSAAKYFKYAAERAGWQVKVYCNSLRGLEGEIETFDPDFIIASWFANPDFDDRILMHRSKKYLWVSLPLEVAYRHRYFSLQGFLKPRKHFRAWLTLAHGMLITPADEIGIYQKIWENQLKKDFNGIHMLPLAPANNYEPAEPKRLSWASLGWDKFRSSEDYKKFITQLSENVPMKVYGPYNHFAYLRPQIYAGYIYAGLENIAAIRRNGIYLLTHSNFHNQSNVPSMRPFEAAAANVITISDKNPFVMEQFGDSMLYFDQNASSQEMYNQVKKHVDWIIANPEQAKAKAEKAHQIFLKKFTVEHDFVRLAKMHEYILAKEKEMELEYPLSYSICK